MRLKAPISGIIEQAQASPTSDAFTRAATLLGNINAEIREEVQASTSSAAQELIGKLRAMEQLNSDDLAVLRLWIVGDAESHVAMENNYNDWLKEFERIKGSPRAPPHRKCCVEAGSFHRARRHPCWQARVSAKTAGKDAGAPGGTLPVSALAVGHSRDSAGGPVGFRCLLGVTAADILALTGTGLN